MIGGDTGGLYNLFKVSVKKNKLPKGGIIVIKRFISLLIIVMMLSSMAVVVSSYDVDDFPDVSSYMTNYENALRYTVE